MPYCIFCMKHYEEAGDCPRCGYGIVRHRMKVESPIRRHSERKERGVSVLQSANENFRPGSHIGLQDRQGEVHLCANTAEKSGICVTTVADAQTAETATAMSTTETITLKMSDEEFSKQIWPQWKLYEGGDGCHIAILGVNHPHFYGNMPCNAWKLVAEWTRESKSR